MVLVVFGRPPLRVRFNIVSGAEDLPQSCGRHRRATRSWREAVACQMPPRQSPRKARDTRLAPRGNGTNGKDIHDTAVVDKDTFSEPVKSKKRIAGTSDPLRPSKKVRVTDTKAVEESKDLRPGIVSNGARVKRSKVVKVEATLDRALPAYGREEKLAKRPRGSTSRAEIEKTEEGETSSTKPTESPRAAAAAVLVGQEEEVDLEKSPKKRERVKKVETALLVKQEEGDELQGGQAPPKKKRSRKTKEEKELEAMPLAARTAGLRMYIGAHVSCAKGLAPCCASKKAQTISLGSNSTNMMTRIRSTKYCHKCCPHWVCIHK